MVEIGIGVLSALLVWLHCRSGFADRHQSYDALVEEVNRPLKAWIAGEPDADLWRSAIRNHQKLTGVRRVVLDRCVVRDPLTEPRVHPPYAEELLKWRAMLRPFLWKGGEVADVRQLESLSGESLNQDAVNMLHIGEERRVKLYEEHLSDGLLPIHRPHQQPLSILAIPTTPQQGTRPTGPSGQDLVDLGTVLDFADFMPDADYSIMPDADDGSIQNALD